MVNGVAIGRSVAPAGKPAKRRAGRCRRTARPWLEPAGSQPRERLAHRRDEVVAATAASAARRRRRAPAAGRGDGAAGRVDHLGDRRDAGDRLLRERRRANRTRRRSAGRRCRPGCRSCPASRRSRPADCPTSRARIRLRRGPTTFSRTPRMSTSNSLRGVAVEHRDALAAHAGLDLAGRHQRRVGGCDPERCQLEPWRWGCGRAPRAPARSAPREPRSEARRKRIKLFDYSPPTRLRRRWLSITLPAARSP